VKPKDKPWRNILRPAITLSILCFIIGVAIVGTHYFTAGIIKEQQELAFFRSMERLLPAATYVEVRSDEREEPFAFSALNEVGEVKGYLILTSAFGYSGIIEVLTAIVEGSVLAIEIVDASGETPGLGQKIREENFTSQFHNLMAPPVLTRSSPVEVGEIQAITGATISAEGVVKAVAEAMELYQRYIRE